MEDKPEGKRPSIPTWVWILAIFAIILGLQFWIRGDFTGSEDISLPAAMDMINSGQVETIMVTGSSLKLALENGEEVVTTFDNRTSPEELFTYFGITEEVLAENDVEWINNDQSTMNTIFSIVLAIGPVLLLIWIFTRGFRQMQGGGSNSIFGFGRSKAKNLNDTDRPTVTFDDVAGVEEAKQDLVEVVQFLREPEKFVQVGARIPKGVLMIGPPGTGKTLLARAIAGEAGVPFFHISGSEFVEMFVGVGASRVRDLFEKAKQSAPSIVFVDELDAVGRQRGAGMGGGNDEREQTLNQILVEMDGFDNETNIIVMAATNRADVLDPALLRPGRFDRKVFVDLPDVSGREKILLVHARGKPIASEVSFTDMARLTAGFSGADLENLINEAAIFAARRDQRTIGILEFQDAFDRVVMGPERKSRVMSEEDKETVAYHEAGHAVVINALPEADTVQKVSIISRGEAGGYTIAFPEEDRLLKSRKQLMSDMIVLLGGRAAEDIVFSDITSGASNDLERVTKLARTMVMRLGMNDELGPMVYGKKEELVFLGREISEQRDYSENTAQQIDKAIQQLVQDAYEQSKAILKKYRNELDQIAEKLLDVETLNADQFFEIFPTPVDKNGGIPEKVV